MASETAGWSEDGQWFWDGSQWNDAVSPDGQHIYNGTAWAPFTGSRSPMPMSPFAGSSPAPAAPPRPPEDPLDALEDYPAWMDPNEVVKLKEDKERRRALARQAPVKSQPIDWSEVHGARRTRRGNRLEKMSRFLLLIVLFWSLVIFMALYALFVYLPAHPLTHVR